MNSKKYWQNRSVQRMFDKMDDAEKAADEIAKFYKGASAYFQRQAEKVFLKYATKHGISRVQARILLNALTDVSDVQSFLNKLESVPKGKELKMFLEGPAYSHRLQRYVNMQKQVDSVMQKVYGQEKNYSDSFYKGLITDSYYKKVFDITQRIGIQAAFSYISEKEIDTILKSKWYSENYSERIWKNTKAVAEAVKEELFLCFVTGQTEREASLKIAERFQSGASQARRLIRTEAAHLSNQLDQRAYKEFGINKYRFVATLDLRTSNICRKMDGKIFLVSEAVPGKNHPPMHPWCRSTTIEIINEKYIDRMKRKFRNPETHEVEEIPLSMTYKDWYKKYVKGNRVEELDKVWKNGKIP